MKKRFPTFAVILFAIAIIWLLNDLKLFVINLPWIPVVLLIVAVGMIINNYSKK